MPCLVTESMRKEGEKIKSMLGYSFLKLLFDLKKKKEKNMDNIFD